MMDQEMSWERFKTGPSDHRDIVTFGLRRLCNLLQRVVYGGRDRAAFISTHVLFRPVK